MKNSRKDAESTLSVLLKSVSIHIIRIKNSEIKKL